MILSEKQNFIVVKNCEKYINEFINQNFLILDYWTDDLNVGLEPTDLILCNNKTYGDIIQNYPNIFIYLENEKLEYQVKDEILTYRI
jgi:hypothetical protein